MTERPIPPADWRPETVTELVRGKMVAVFRWKGHEIACRGDTVEAYHAFRAECWDLVKRLADGQQTVAYAHEHRHDPARRRPEHAPSASMPVLFRTVEDAVASIPEQP
jgi:hypothetical protein